MDWRNRLKKKHLEHVKRTAPGFFDASGGYEMKVQPYTDKDRQGLFRCVMDWINFSGGEARETKRGYVRKVGGKMVWIHSPAQKETCDIQGVYKSQTLEIHVQHRQDLKVESVAAGYRVMISCFDHFLNFWKTYLVKSDEFEEV